MRQSVFDRLDIGSIVEFNAISLGAYASIPNKCVVILIKSHQLIYYLILKLENLLLDILMI